QFVEASRGPEVGETLAQPVPTAVAVRRLLHGGQQRREIEVGAKRDRYVDDRQAGRCDRRDRRLDSWGGCALVPRLAGLDLDRTSRIGLRPSAPTGGRLVAPQDAVVSTKEPPPARPPARERPPGLGTRRHA